MDLPRLESTSPGATTDFDWVRGFISFDLETALAFYGAAHGERFELVSESGQMMPLRGGPPRGTDLHKAL